MYISCISIYLYLSIFIYISMVIMGYNCSIVALIPQHDGQLGAPGTTRNPSAFGMRHAVASSPKMDLLVGGGEAWQGLLELLAHGFPEIHDRATWFFIKLFRDLFLVGAPIMGKSVSGQHQGLSKPVLKLYAKIATVMSKVFVLLRQRRNTMLSPDKILSTLGLQMVRTSKLVN